MDSTEQNRHTIWHVLAFVIAFVACTSFFILNPQLLGGGGGTRVSMDVDISEGWTTEDGSEVELGNLNALPNFAQDGATIRRQLPNSIESGIEFNFLSKNVTVHLFYGETEVYAYDPETDVYGTPYSAYFNFAPLSSSDAGKEAVLRIEPVYAENSCQILDVRLSGTAAYIQRYVRNHGIAFIMSLFISFIGIGVIVMHVALRNMRHEELDLLSLGSFCILLGIWSGAETLIPKLITGLATFVSALDYMALLFCPYLLVRFVTSLVRPRRGKICCRIAFVLAIAAVCLTMGLAYIAGYNMHQLLVITHALLFTSCAIVVYEIVSSLRSVFSKGLARSVLGANRDLLFAFLIMVCCAILDFARYNLTSRGTTDSAFFMRIGLFVFAIVLAIEAFRKSVEFIERADHADAIEAIAYVDALTGVGNRAAWQHAHSEIDDALESGAIEDAMVCQLDVNFLKQVNDTLGHAAGDAHLKRAADTINRSFGTEGACYRTGGDEFTVLIVGVLLNERLEQCMSLFSLSITEQEAMDEGQAPLSIAIGHACVSETEPGTISAAQELADERMYEHKRSMKAVREE